MRNEETLNLDHHRKKLTERAIRKAQGDKKQAAQLLGINHRTLYNYLDRFNLKQTARNG